MPKLTTRQLDRIAAAVRTVEGEPTSMGGGGKGSTAGRQVIPARIVSASTGKHAWSEIDPVTRAVVSGGLAGTTTGREALSIDGSDVPAGTEVLLFPVGIEDGNGWRRVFVFQVGGGGDLPDATLEGQVVLANNALNWIASFPKLHP